MLAEKLESAAADPQALEQWFDDQLDRALQKREQAKTHSLSIMVTKGSLDWAYPPFIVASTAAAMGWKVTMFFTFYGLTLLKKHLDLKLSGLGNPAMPMKVPYGPGWLRGIEWQMPNLVMAGVPGFENMATRMMKKTLRDKGVAPVEELRTLCLEANVRMVGCQMTRDLFGWDESELIPEVAEWAGAASYLGVMRECDENLYM
ncbi:MAG: DsrE/DsrF/DrsH-like family protein [Thiohalocapsa sp.]|jgi:peroxiredoxin family protein